jgi:putative nucleotidyltransferase with HDIG domain
VEVAAHEVELDGRRAVLAMVQDVSARVAATRSVADHVRRLERSITGTVDAMSVLVELRDPYTAGHQRRVGELGAAIARELGLDADVQRGLRIAGSLHDVGKVMVPAEILTRARRLTAAETELVRQHAQDGYDVLKSIEFPWPVAEVARQHHERLDGSGYPRGLVGDAILLEARIVAVADVVDAMTGHRPYRPALGLGAALAELEGGAGRVYDADVVAACVRVVRKGFTFDA